MHQRILILFLLLTFSALLFAQSSGKIVGIVTDKSSGEPLPGVNVSLVGSALGAATDGDGYYVILNVPVGSVDVLANYVGYQELTISGLRVSADLTTSLDIALSETTIEGETVVITAARPLVEKNITQSVSLITSNELETIPVRGFNNIMALQNSVVLQDNLLHIRGGRNEEVGYFLDGAAATNPLNNTQAIYIIQEAVEEFQVLTGGYTAEFGGANSGIIRTELKTGASDYRFSMDYQSDKFASEGETFLGTHSFREHIGVASLSGPVPFLGDKVRFFIAGENSDIGDRQKRFSEGWSFNLIDRNIINEAIDLDPNTGEIVGGDTVLAQYPDGFTPLNGFERWATNGTLLFDFSPIRFRVSGTYNNSRTYVNNRPQLNFLNERQGFIDNNTLLLTGKLTHVLNPKTFYNMTVSFYDRENERKDSYFGGDWRSWFDGNKIAEFTNGEVQFRRDRESDQNAWKNPHFYQFNGIPFARNGHTPMFGSGNASAGNSTLYRLERENYLSGSLDFVSQVGKHNELKAGGSVRRYTSRKFEIEPDVMGLTEQFTSGVAESVDPGLWASQGEYDGYGFDIYGNEIDKDVAFGDSVYMDAPRHPVFGALYLQDKVEFDDLIINAGLRMDYFDSDDKSLINPGDPAVDPRTGLIAPEAFEKVDPYIQVSPRLGISFPVSEKTVFYAQYGKFIQMPELNDVYYGSYGFSDQITSGGNYFVQPVGFGLKPIRTTSYELGLRRQVGSAAAIDVTGFYRNDKGQIKVIQQQVPASSGISTYARLVNGDFVTTRGMELRVSLRRFNRLQAQLNYTLTKAEGTGSNELSTRGAIARNTVTPTLVNPLDFNQVHRGSMILDYRFGEEEGGLLSNFGANMLFTFNSGHPYTFVTFDPGGQIDAYDAGVDYMLDTRSREAVEAIGSSTTPWNFNVDLRLDKALGLVKSVDALLYLRVNNLFNIRNVLNVYEGTGNADDDGYLSRPEYSEDFINANGGSDYVNLYRAINLENGGSYSSQIGRELWGSPRQVFLGIQLSY